MTDEQNTTQQPFKVWQAIGGGSDEPYSRLVEHLIEQDAAATVCKQAPYSVYTPENMPDPDASEDVWYSDHDVPDKYIIRCMICATGTRDARLEALRALINAEPPERGISYGEIAELTDLAQYITPGDVELLQWAGVPEEWAHDPAGWVAAGSPDGEQR